MARSADPDRQATRAVRAISAFGQSRHGNRDDGKVHGLGTARQYTQIFRTAATWFNERHGVQLFHVSTDQAKQYLEAALERYRAKAAEQRTPGAGAVLAPRTKR